MESAIADIIDNSITAEATIVGILTPPESPNPELYIYDNGHGMSLDDLDNAMTFGGRDFIEQRSKKDLGRYGLGLKTASLSQCKIFSVVSKKEGRICGGSWDLNHVKKYNRWEYIQLNEQACLKILEVTPLINYSSGTVVFWEDFDRLRDSARDERLEFNTLLSNSQSHLELVFHRFLSGEPGLTRIKIIVNGRQLEPNDPFLSKKNPKVVEPIVIRQGKDVDDIVITPHKLIHPKSLTQNELKRLQVKGTLMHTQGFYVYRNKRLLIWGTWFRLAPKIDKTKLSRIQVDIPNALDQLWSLDIKKSTAIPPAHIREQLQNILRTINNISKKTFEIRVRINKNAIPFWLRIKLPNGNYRYGVNKENPLIQTFIKQLSNEQKSTFNSILNDIETFFPIAQLQLDFQNDLSTENEISADSFDSEALLNKFLQLRVIGLTTQDIIKIEPFCNHKYFIDQIIKKEIKIETNESQLINPLNND